MAGTGNNGLTDKVSQRMLKIGPAGWSYADWAGKVYPTRKPQGFDPLEYLSGYFDTIEINSTFYRMPYAATVAGWVKKVAANPHFTFTAKLTQPFTHTRQASAQDEVTFKKGMEPLRAADRLGALLLQFPYAFHNTPENREYLRQLAQRFREDALVLEVRHASWDRPYLYAFLQELGVGFCNIDQPRVSYSLGPTRRATGPVGYLRLHGRNAVTWFQEDVGRDARYDYLYSDDELNDIAETTKAIAAQAPVTYLITNNHFRGQAVVNALQLQHKLGYAEVRVPQQLLALHPELGQLIRGNTPREGMRESPDPTKPGGTAAQMELPLMPSSAPGRAEAG